MQTDGPKDKDQHLLAEHTSVASPLSKNKQRLMWGLVALGIAVLPSGAIIKLSSKSGETPPTNQTSLYPTDAPELFNRMIDQSLVTASMTEQRIVWDSTGLEVSKGITTYDLSDMHNVRIFSIHESYLLPDKPETFTHVELISVPEGVYMSFKEMGNIPQNKLGHWFAVQENGKNDPDGIQLYYSNDPKDYANSYMGFYIPGVFDTETREKIKDFIKTKELYQFFSEDVRKVTENDKTYYTYEYEDNPTKFVEFNKLIADSLGKTPPSGTAESISKLDGKTKLWINTETARLERVDMEFVDGDSQTIYYYDYNVPSIIKKPMPLAPAKFVGAYLEAELPSLLRPDELQTHQD